MYSKVNYNNLPTGFSTAIYCRLSREDEGVLQSESITNQREFLVRYVREQGWQLYDTYVDDGFSGTTFDRPDFKRLLQDIEAGRVNLVITKDLSRLGRDYINTGHYLEKYFPEKRVRYIAVNDGIDTFVDKAGNDITPFRAVINDLYARDISVKVRAALDTKRMEGKFIGAFPPYGYRKDPLDKNKLIIDEETAPIVKRIFHMYINGWGYSKIAHRLNEEEITTPTEYKNRLRGGRGKMKTSLWNHCTVKVILQNPTYIGNLRQRINKKINYKTNKFTRIPREGWIIVENTHEPIVNPKIFHEANEKINRNKGKFKFGKTRHLFSGLAYCADCGGYMTFQYKGPDHQFLICSTYKQHTSRYCSRHAIPEEVLRSLVMRDIRQMAAASLDRSSLIQQISIPGEIKNRPRNRLQLEMIQINSRRAEIDRVMKTLYTDRVNGLISPQQFLELSSGFLEEKNTLKLRAEVMCKKLAELSQPRPEKDNIKSMADNLLKMQNLDLRTLEKLVEKIEVFEKNRIRIHYRFKQPYSDHEVLDVTPPGEATESMEPITQNQLEKP